ncbi:hypothetical protein ILUMI_04836 [Ignelater luminosus]|uniref:RNA-directed DNA polymerase n=1 Tax=Ignelater luminosus TaxID=2038154 RepID=A0A8K0GJ79_IGNLU|nr:hypothetical protein ILUMI_04836 [Ignelater luminosus]
MLRDQTAFGILDGELKKKFLQRNVDTLTLQNIINQCRVQEATETQFKHINKDETFHKIEKKKLNVFRTCKFCAKKHAFMKGTCPARDSICNFCSSKGHYEKCCLKKRNAKKKEYEQKNKSVKEIKKELSSTDEDTEVYIEVQKIITEYEDLFQEYGTLEGTVSLEIDKNIVPIIQKPRRIPINIRKALKDELQNLDKAGIIMKKGEHTDWNVRLNKSKLKLCQLEVPFYGHILTNEGVKPDFSKTQAIKEMPTSTNKQELHRFLDIKALKYFRKHQPITLECDASSGGLCAAMYQDDGVVAYAFRTLTSTEKNHAMIEKVFTCSKFDKYIVGNPMVTVKTDHKPLVAIFKKPLLNTPKRLQATLMSLQRYNINLLHVNGKNNVFADTLSRLPLNDQLHIFQVSNTEKHIAKINIIKVQNGLILRDDRILIPFNLRKIMIEKLHTSHTGIENSLKLSKQNLFWPGMTQEITEKIRYCEICQRHSNNLQKLPMMSSLVPDYPWQVISMCFAEYQGKNRKILVLVDHYSDYFEASFLKDLKPNSVIACLKEIFSRFSIPELLIFDRAYHIFTLPSTMKCKQELWWLLLHHRNTPNKIALTPVQRLMSRQTRHGLPSLNLKSKKTEDVTKNIEDRHKHSKLYYDRNTKDLPAPSVGNKVPVQLKPILIIYGQENMVNVKLRQETEENLVSVENSESVNINKEQANQNNKQDSATNVSIDNFNDSATNVLAENSKNSVTDVSKDNSNDSSKDSTHHRVRRLPTKCKDFQMF